MVQTRKRGLYYYILLVMVGAAFVLPLLFMRGIEVHAVINPSITIEMNTSDSANLANIRVASYSSEGNFTFFTFSTAESASAGKETVIIRLDTVKYEELSSAEKKTVMTNTLKAIKACNMGEYSEMKIYNFVAEQDESVSKMVKVLSDDVKADYATAYEWYRPFSGGVSTFMGVIALLIFITLGLMMVMDLAYLVIPMFRQFFEKDGKEKPKFISQEAVIAMKEAEASHEYKAPIGIYFKHKTFQLVIVSICLAYLLGGKIYTLVAWLMDAVANVFW